MVKSFRLSIVNRYDSQKGVRYVNKRLLDLERKARSLKKRSFFISPKYCIHCSPGLLDKKDCGFGVPAWRLM